MVILLSEGAAADAAARARLAGEVNAMHIDTVLARGGQGQDTGRLGRKFRSEDDDPVAPDDRSVAPWVGARPTTARPAAAAEAERVLDEVQLADPAAAGAPAGPDYQHYWVDRVRPGLARLWPLPWPGRFDRAGWRTILVSWLLMLLLAALAVLIAILIFRNQPPQPPPPPTGSSGSPPPQSSSPSPQSGSPSPQSGSPSPQSGSPSPQSGSPSGSPSRLGIAVALAARVRPRRPAPRPVAASRPPDQSGSPGSRTRPGRSSSGGRQTLSDPVPLLIVTDLDGTFLSPDGTVSERTPRPCSPRRRPASRWSSPPAARCAGWT